MASSESFNLVLLINLFREKQEKRDLRAEKEKEQRELQHQLLVSRRHAIRHTRQKQLDMISAMAPGKVLLFHERQCYNEFIYQFHVRQRAKFQ